MKNNMCDHKEYNAQCVMCLDIEAHCGYATKEGFVDFDKNTKWSEKLEYYRKCDSYEEDTDDRDYQDEEIERQIVDARQGVNE